MGDSHMGLQARLMSQALRKLAGAVKASGTSLIFTNQLRQKIGVMFGNPETTSGGMALKFYASVRLDVRRIQTIKKGSDPIGNRTRVTVKKNKVAPPFKVAEFDIMYNEGISTMGDLIDIGVNQEIITKRGSFYSYGETRLGQGRENAKTFLAENPEMAAEIDALIFPGGFGAAKNLCDFAVAGAACTVHPQVEAFLKQAHDANRPIGAMCIAPVILARVFGKELNPRLTIGSDPTTAAAMNEMGAEHVDCPVSESVVDRRNRMVTTPAYMLANRIGEVFSGAQGFAEQLLALCD
jgi:putative intracellular protease/amidase